MGILFLIISVKWVYVKNNINKSKNKKRNTKIRTKTKTKIKPFFSYRENRLYQHTILKSFNKGSPKKEAYIQSRATNTKNNNISKGSNISLVIKVFPKISMI